MIEEHTKYILGGISLLFRRDIDADVGESTCPLVKTQGNIGVVSFEDARRTSNSATIFDAENPTVSSTERTSTEMSQFGAHEWRSHDARRATIGTAAVSQEKRREVAGIHCRDGDHSHLVGNVDRGAWRRESSTHKPTLSEGTETQHTRAAKCKGPVVILEEKPVYGGEDNHGQTQTAVRYAAPDDRGYSPSAAFNNSSDYTRGDTVDPETDSNAKGSLPRGRGTTNGREKAWPPSPPSCSNGSGTRSYLPHRRYDASQERRDSARALLPDYRPLSFVERQELEQLDAKHRHEELVRAEEEARRKLASGGCRMNRSSRTILARSSSSYCGGGGGGRFSSPPPGTGGQRQEPSVFERLARRGSDQSGTNSEEWARDRSIEDNGGDGRRPFTPMINRRSSQLAPRVSRRDEEDCPQQRLYRDGEEQLRRRERRVQLAERALREKSVCSHVNPESERVLARRNRSKVVLFRSKMMEILEVSQ